MSVEIEPPVPLPTVELLESDGIPLETHWHVMQINLLLESIYYRFRERTDFYAAGNMFIYFSEEQARNRDYRGPDFFYVDGVNRTPIRRYWAVWLEGGRYPDVIIELLSPTTAVLDRTVKKRLYERTFHTHEYICYEPDDRHLEGWRLNSRQRFRKIAPNENGWLWVEEFQLWVGTWRGSYQRITNVWLRFYDSDGNLVLLEGEAEKLRAEAEQRRAEAESQRADAEGQRVEAEKQRAEAESQRAENEKQRAEAAEKELVRLREQIAELEKQARKPG